jgi:dolichol kinase
MTPKDVILTSQFFQFALYAMVRLARQGMTVGELGFIAQGATVIFLEAVNFAFAKVLSPNFETFRTYRAPTPLLIYQHALLPGPLLIGLLLSPLLYLSRHTASRRFRRRNPTEDKKFRESNNTQRKFLALGFYAFSALIIGGPIGLYAHWSLGKRNPWMWAIYWILQGRRSWTRPLLVVYWATLVTLSIWGWNRRLTRMRRFRPTLNGSTTSYPTAASSGVSSATSEVEPATTGGSGWAPGVPSGAQVQGLVTQANEMAAELLDAAGQRVPALGLNARRKFFHGLAVAMFLPAIWIDVRHSAFI